MLCPPHDAVHTLTSRPRQDRFGGHQRREPASRHRQSSSCAVIWARQGCSAQRLSAARQRERRRKEDIAQIAGRWRFARFLGANLMMQLGAISGPRNLSFQENPVVESGVQTPDSDPIKEYKEWLEYSGFQPRS